MNDFWQTWWPAIVIVGVIGLIIGGIAIEANTGHDERTTMTVTGRNYQPESTTFIDHTDEKGNLQWVETQTTPASWSVSGVSEEGETVIVDVSEYGYNSIKLGARRKVLIHEGGLFKTRSAYLVEE